MRRLPRYLAHRNLVAVFHVLDKQGVVNMVKRIASLCKDGGRLIATCAGSCSTPT